MSNRRRPQHGRKPDQHTVRHQHLNPFQAQHGSDQHMQDITRVANNVITEIVMRAGQENRHRLNIKTIGWSVLVNISTRLCEHGHPEVEIDDVETLGAASDHIMHGKTVGLLLLTAETDGLRPKASVRFWVVQDGETYPFDADATRESLELEGFPIQPEWEFRNAWQVDLHTEPTRWVL